MTFVNLSLGLVVLLPSLLLLLLVALIFSLEPELISASLLLSKLCSLGSDSGVYFCNLFRQIGSKSIGVGPDSIHSLGKVGGTSGVVALLFQSCSSLGSVCLRFN